MGEEVERVKGYIDKVEELLLKLKERELPKECKGIVSLAEAYLQDSKYYLYDKGDYFTSLACIAYSEGLLDSLRHMGLMEFEWPRASRKRVLVGGVFDILHPGHLFLLKKAKERGRVVVVVARDSTVIRVKGRPPILPEKYRALMLKGLKYVDEVVLGEEGFDVKEILRRLKPDIVLLGPDQASLEPLIRESTKELGLKIEVIRIRESLKCEVCKTSKILEKILKSFKGP